MTEDQSPQKMSNAGLVMSGITALVGVAGAIAIYRQPESLQVPLWLAMIACFCFALSGLALSLKTTRFTRLFQWTIVLLLLCMASVPAWLTLGDSVGSCTASFPLIANPLGCRVAFGVSTALTLLLLVSAVKAAVRGPAV